MKGKKRCKILKEIRRQIAENNDIEFVTSECKHQGDCLGTCPKCEAEVRYLERELEKRMKLGKAVAVAGLAVALTTSAVGCDDLFDGLRPTGGDPLPPEEYEQSAGQLAPPTEDDGDIVTEGEIPVSDEGDEDDDVELGGEPAIEPEDIMGDMPV
jgi:hypothetical protein